MENKKKENIDYTPYFLNESHLCDYLEYDDFLYDDRLQFAFPMRNDLNNDKENYICICLNKKDNEKYSKIVGIITMVEKNNNNTLFGVSVDKEYRKLGISKILIDTYKQFSKENNFNMVISSYTKEGEKYIQPYIEKNTLSFF